MIETDRLRLRRWCESDILPLAALNADPRVMEFYLAPLSRLETERMILRIERSIEQKGFGFWAAGFIGLNIPEKTFPFSPCVEIGWRLAHPFWGKGFATEGAKASLQFGFEEIGLPEIVALTATINVRSRRVMEKIGMSRQSQDDFDFPSVALDHPLRPHVLYRVHKSSC